MKQLIATFCGLSLLSLSASALELNITPGSLADDYVEIRNTSDLEFKLSGTADVRDLILLKHLSKSVSSIDLSGLDIRAYTFPEGDYMGRASFEEGELPPYILTGCTSTSIALPASLKSIGQAAFVGSKLESIEFPASLQSIGDYAFANSDNLKNAVFNQDMTIGAGVFKDCKALKNVDIKYNITEIPNEMFSGCTSFEGNIPSSVKKIGKYAYYGTPLQSVNLIKVESVGDFAFAEMPYLESIILDRNRELTIGTGAFFNDISLEVIPSLDTDMAKSAFAHTNAIMSSLINSETIEAGAYSNNSTLDSIYFGETVRHIASHAFRNDFNLKLIDASRLEEDVPTVEEDSFSGLLNDEGRYDIDLNVLESMQAQWEADPVWSLFNIGQFVVGIEDVTAEVSTAIRVAREAHKIRVESTLPIDYVGIFGLNGTVLHESMPGATTFVSPDLSGGDDVLIVKVISGGIEKISKLR